MMKADRDGDPASLRRGPGTWATNIKAAGGVTVMTLDSGTWPLYGGGVSVCRKQVNIPRAKAGRKKGVSFSLDALEVSHKIQRRVKGRATSRRALEIRLFIVFFEARQSRGLFERRRISGGWAYIRMVLGCPLNEKS